MITFWTICGLLIVLALAIVLPPLLTSDRAAAGVTAAAANVAVYRRQLAELESDRRERILTDDEFSRDRDELERRLAVDLLGDSRLKRRERSAFALVGLLAAGIPLAAVGLYLLLGSPPSP